MMPGKERACSDNTGLSVSAKGQEWEGREEGWRKIWGMVEAERQEGKGVGGRGTGGVIIKRDYEKSYMENYFVSQLK